MARVSGLGCAAPRRRQPPRRRGRNVRRRGNIPPRHRRLFREGHVSGLRVSARRPRARRRPRRSAATGPPPGARDGTRPRSSTRQRARATARDALAVASVADIPIDTHVIRQCRDSADIIRSSARCDFAPNPHTRAPTPSRDRTRTLVGDAVTSRSARARRLFARTAGSQRLLTHLFIHLGADKHLDGISDMRRFHSFLSRGTRSARSLAGNSRELGYIFAFSRLRENQKKIAV